jgi:hypothetical protein
VNLAVPGGGGGQTPSSPGSGLEGYLVEVSGADGTKVSLDGAEVATGSGYLVANALEGNPPATTSSAVLGGSKRSLREVPRCRGAVCAGNQRDPATVEVVGRPMRPKGAVYVLTGERGSGKTLVCTELVAAARARGLDVAGILTGLSGLEPDGPRQVIDIRSGSSRLFGAQTANDEAGATSRGRRPRSAAGNGAGRATAGTSSDLLTPGWEYEAEVFAWADEVLSRATPCDLLIVDELGPLELLGGRGWVGALSVLRAGDFVAALVVCRPGLLDELEASLDRPPAHLFEAVLETSDTLPAAILKEMFA